MTLNTENDCAAVCVIMMLVFAAVEKLWRRWWKLISRRFSMARCLFLTAARTFIAEIHFPLVEKRLLPFVLCLLAFSVHA